MGRISDIASGKTSVGGGRLSGVVSSESAVKEKNQYYLEVQKKSRYEEVIKKVEKAQEEAQKASENLKFWEGIAGIPKQIYQAGKETGASVIDVASRLSPLENVRNTYSGLSNVVNGPSNVPADLRYEQGFQESRGRKTLFEKVSGKELTNPDGSINWDAGRQFIGRAAEAPTYIYAGAAQGAELVAKGLLTRILTRTAKSLPEATVNTGIQQFEQGNTENIGTNFLANALLLSGISNIAGEVKFSKEAAKKTISDIESELGTLSLSEKSDVLESIKQGVKPADIVENVRKVKNNEVAPEELASKINEQAGVTEQSKTEVKLTPEDPLLQEVRSGKYANAEEFVNSKATVWRAGREYHPSRVNPDDGVSFSYDKNVAQKFADMAQVSGGNAVPRPFYIKPEAKILDMKDIPKEMWNSEYDMVAYATKNGYDAIKIDQLGQYKEAELRVVNPDVIVDRHQLIDLYNKAQGGAESHLLQEAGKYKSAEEFVKAQGTPVFRGAETSELRRTNGDLGNAYYLTEDKNLAGVYAGKKNTVHEYRISQDAKIADQSIIPYGVDRAEWAKENGYDGISYEQGKYAETERFNKSRNIVIYDDKALEKIKTKSQLTDLYNKAQEKKIDTSLPEQPKPDVTPKKESGYAKSLEEKAVEKKMASEFQDLAEYTPAVRKEQAQMTTKLINEDIEKVNSILDGKAELPSGMRGSSLALAVEQHAIANNDVKLLHKLAKSKIATGISEAGSELSMLAGRNANSPVRIIRNIIKARKENIVKRLKGKKISEARKVTKESIKKAIKKEAPTKETWSNFIKEIKC